MQKSSRIVASILAAIAVAFAVASLGPAVAQTQAVPAPTARPGTEAGRELLNSERIESKFGSYGIEVLHSDEKLRVSNLYSESGGQRIGRTFAVVFYPERVDPSFAAEHSAIVDGGSIGAVFAMSGWRVAKSHRYFGAVAATPKVAELMRIEAGLPLAVHVYVLSVAKAGESHDYAAIAEVHHPDYLQLPDLASIYGRAAPRADDAALVARILDAMAAAMR